MTSPRFVFFLEERSAEIMLEILLPRLLPASVLFSLHSFQGKSDLEKKLPKRLRGWQDSNAHFIILRDQDSGDCLAIKKRLVGICVAAGRPQTLTRIACRELKSWYLADLNAVEKGLRITGVSQHQQKKKYRAPDYLGSPSSELKKLTRNRYQKISGSRNIAPFLDLTNKRSVSFGHFIAGLQKLVADTCT